GLQAEAQRLVLAVGKLEPDDALVGVAGEGQRAARPGVVVGHDQLAAAGARRRRRGGAPHPRQEESQDRGGRKPACGRHRPSIGGRRGNPERRRDRALYAGPPSSLESAAMTATVGVALVGAGPWGMTLGRAAAGLPNVDLRWICELNQGRRQAAAELAPSARLTAALDEALADRQVDAVLVAVDSPSHHAVGRLVLEADRHLLVEKPMAMTVTDAADLSALAAARRRILSVGHLLLQH